MLRCFIKNAFFLLPWRCWWWMKLRNLHSLWNQYLLPRLTRTDYITQWGKGLM
jgi:hypothetical protein